MDRVAISDGMGEGGAMSRYSLKNRVVIITGASAGIGEALARQVAGKGGKVVLAARRVDLIQKLQAEIREKGGLAIAVETDVSKSHDRERLLECALKEWGKVDVLINNAGFGIFGPFEQIPFEKIRENYETNLFAPMALTQLLLPQMIQNRDGMIVNIESIVGLRAMPGSSCYSGTKHALNAFSESIRVELKTRGIHVLSICPGLIESEFHGTRLQVGEQKDLGPSWMFMSSGRCAAKIIRAMEGRKRQRVITGHAWWLAACQRISPSFVDWVLGIRYRSRMDR